MTDIPKISYSIADIPIVDSQRRWELKPSQAALLVHDYQNYFLNFLSPLLQQELLDATNRIIKAARNYEMPIIFSGQAGYGDRAERGIIRDLWGKGMASSGTEIELDPRLSRSSTDYTVTKQRYSAFASTNLASILSATRRNQLVLCGIYGSVGIIATAYDCVNRDLESFLIPDAIADFTSVDHELTVNLLSAYSSDLLYSSEFGDDG
ncbi:isochorismate hydrolase [Corynebacterium mustelae]|uniref:Isochorismate hydrolase n=1 Tax=Corynebacterium mustelae TaxID=571915 RepID=A0A0G3H388_9CORY|nr:isochorismatase family protein [Corynebacterium mustelae]AKK07200.1 isochorismate hydrolase [Corynebacterium mustelae]